MDLLEMGSRGYQIGALGIVAFAISFFVVVRWWTDLLGRVLAFIFGVISVVLVLSAYRSLTQTEAGGFLVVRAIVYWVYGIGIWTGLALFYWFQFFAPRIRNRTTRRERDEQESNVAAPRPRGDGGAYDRTGRDG